MVEEKMVQTGFRLPATLLARVEGELEKVKKEHPGLRLTRADVVRELLVQALDERQWFREHPRKAWPGPANRKKAG